jgi:hypothetical protein
MKLDNGQDGAAGGSILHGEKKMLAYAPGGASAPLKLFYANTL